ncbi:MAG: biopolymer transporter ExbD [Tannerella sp.]|jgi:biopolymer transport protein ExbD|nr:biopolymer transporter ExbD [Tannerella sp.]
MARKKRKVPGINGASSADIAFMLLLFFLLTTSMDTDQGLPRRLPRPPETNKMEEQQVNKRNILTVMVSSDNRIMCASEEVSLAQLRERAKEFIENPNNSETLPEKEAIDIPFFGTQMVTANHIISLQCDRGTRYQTYIDVQNELAAAYNDLRDVISRRQFDKPFKGLDDEDQRQAVMKYYPQKISEAEPQRYGDKKK